MCIFHCYTVVDAHHRIAGVIGLQVHVNVVNCWNHLTSPRGKSAHLLKQGNLMQWHLLSLVTEGRALIIIKKVPRKEKKDPMLKHC